MMAGQDNVQWVNVSAQETLHKVIAGQETTLVDFGAMNVNLRWSLGSMNQPLGDWGGPGTHPWAPGFLTLVDCGRPG